MAWILRLVLWLPAWIILILAGGVFYAGTQVIHVLDVENRALIAASKMESAQLVDFDPAATVAPGEVALRAKMFDDAAYRFYYSNDGPEDYVEYFWFMEAPESTETDRVFSGVLVFESESTAQVEAWWKSILVDPENDNDLAVVHGYADQGDALSHEASEALYSLGGTAAGNFVFIRPFVTGRDAFYQGKILPMDMIRYGLWLVVGLMLSWAVIRHVIGRRAQAAAAAGVGNPAKTAVGAASVAVGIAGLGDQDDEEEDEGEYGLALSIGKLLFGFFWKRRAAKKTAQHSEPEAVGAPAMVQQAPQRQKPEQATYKAYRPIYDEQGMPIRL